MKKNRLAARAAVLAVCAVTIGVLLVALYPAMAAAPQPAAGAMNRAATAPPVNPLVDALPQQWGNPQPARRPAPAPKPVEKPSTALVPLPPAQKLARMPVGRVQIGEGQVDPNSAMRHAAVYVVRAQAPGIVEYLYDQSAVTRLGQPLVRLYDLSILSDLRIGESVMARFATSPFVIAPRQAGLPPLPPPNFPKPTALQRLLGLIRPNPRPSLAPQAQVQAPARGQLAPSTGGGLAKSTGLQPGRAEEAPTPEPAAAPAPAPRAEKPAHVGNITRTTGDIAAARERIAELTQAIAGTEAQMGQAEEDLKEARDDEAARERLFKQGVLARNLYEAAQRKVASLEDDLASLKRKLGETTQARETALQRLAHLQEQLDQQVASRQGEAAESAAPAPRPAAASKPRRASGLAPARSAPTPAPQRASVVSPRPAQAAAGFPDPTQPRRPELRRLPRLARPYGGTFGGNTMVGAREIPAVPTEVKRLADQRWVDQAAPGEGLVLRQLVPPGSQVKPGQPLLEVANREFARVYSDIPSADVSRFRKGAPVRISFDGYPGVVLEGWVNDLQHVAKTSLVRVEMVVAALEGYYPEDTYASLEWLALAAPMVDDDRPEAVTPATVERRTAGRASIYELMPVVPPAVGPGAAKATELKKDEYVGLVRMAEMDGSAASTYSSPQNAQRLAKLKEWRESFTAGMQTGIFGNLVLSYPRDAEVGDAVERMASGRVSHIPNRCAGTMREALGWGLGDAAVWLKRLPERGYKPRKDGLARPGDILVWPFTYGPRRNQHIGIAVNQGGRLMLLSNLSGTLGTTELTGGYVAFHKPVPKAAKQAAAAQTVAAQSQASSRAR